MVTELERAQDIARHIIQNVNSVIVGKERAVEFTLLVLICRGHALIEDVPGVGKTMLARSVAASVGCAFKRIQFTPDLLPSDVTGVFVYNQKTGDFEFRPGPVISQIVLADEINRATPKTQSALLESMEEQQVTVDGVTHPLPDPFMVMATQNPIEYEGTFPLPEAQLDRFLLRITLGYPTAEEEITIMENQQQAHPIDSLEAVVGPQEISFLQKEAQNIYIDSLVKQYIVSLTEATRSHPDIALGGSPRASLALFRGSQALSMIRGRDYVTPDDVKELAESVLAHRVIISAASRLRGVDGKKVISELVQQVPVPGAEARGWLRS